MTGQAEQATIDVDLEGPVSPPRDNGAIVFDAPWERRAFGIVLALCQDGRFAWEDFRQQLIAQIAADEDRPYWESWAAALEAVLSAGAALSTVEVEERADAFLARPHGHDHRDDEHGHGHGH
ncbi:nitrile hydratase accessory protein [Nocardioides sp. WS12]|uniref:nitrile hydratase accessory protein n=1 Tax=Nocardioides sp. WS12 TaxID=2486272 RepID=UPI0015FA38D4|nr:nitrile hydratase accessory protein [Nocardioides sp. WS12]